MSVLVKSTITYVLIYLINFLVTYLFTSYWFDMHLSLLMLLSSRFPFSLQVRPNVPKISVGKQSFGDCWNDCWRSEQYDTTGHTTNEL